MKEDFAISNSQRSAATPNNAVTTPRKRAAPGGNSTTPGSSKRKRDVRKRVDSDDDYEDGRRVPQKEVAALNFGVNESSVFKSKTTGGFDITQGALDDPFVAPVAAMKVPFNSTNVQGIFPLLQTPAIVQPTVYSDHLSQPPVYGYDGHDIGSQQPYASISHQDLNDINQNLNSYLPNNHSTAWSEFLPSGMQVANDFQQQINAWHPAQQQYFDNSSGVHHVSNADIYHAAPFQHEFTPDYSLEASSQGVQPSQILSQPVQEHQLDGDRRSKRERRPTFKAESQAYIDLSDESGDLEESGISAYEDEEYV